MFTTVMALCSCLWLILGGPLPCIRRPSLRNVCRHHPLHLRCCRRPCACDSTAAELDLLPEDSPFQVMLLVCMVFTLLAEGPSLAPPLLSQLVAVLHLMLCVTVSFPASCFSSTACSNSRGSTELLCACLCSSEGQGGSQLQRANAMQASVTCHPRPACWPIRPLAVQQWPRGCPAIAPAAARHAAVHVLLTRLVLAGVPCCTRHT